VGEGEEEEEGKEENEPGEERNTSASTPDSGDAHGYM
jgi:hypothetical protein